MNKKIVRVRVNTRPFNYFTTEQTAFFWRVRRTSARAAVSPAVYARALFFSDKKSEIRRAVQYGLSEICVPINMYLSVQISNAAINYDYQQTVKNKSNNNVIVRYFCRILLLCTVTAYSTIVKKKKMIVLLR